MWCWLGIDKDSSTFGPADANIFRNLALLTIGIGGFCSFLFHIMVKLEPQRHGQGVITEQNLNPDNDGNEFERCDTVAIPCEENPESPNFVSSLHQTTTRSEKPMTVVNWLCEPRLYYVACLYTFSRLFVNVSQAYMPLYLNVTLGLPATYVAIIPMIMYISGIFIAIITKSASNRIGITITSGIYSCVGIIGCLWMHWGNVIHVIFQIEC